MHLFSSYRSPNAAATDTADNADSSNQNPIDHAGLRATTAVVRPDEGQTNAPFLTPNGPYDRCARVTNAGGDKSGQFMDQFRLSGDQDPAVPLNFPVDAGLDAGAQVLAHVNLAPFPNAYKLYTRQACLYSASAPAQPLTCGETFHF